MSRINTPVEIERLRVSGLMLAQVLEVARQAVRPGISAEELDAIAHKEIIRLGAKPAFLGYHGFPKVMCVSINEEVQHAIPGRRVLREGDIVNLDCGVNYEGMITDAGISVGVGKISADARRLLRACEEALAAGLAEVKAGGHTGDISHAIEQRLVADRLGIVKDLAGHGVGHDLHEDPTINNFGKPGRGPKLEAGMSIAVEPIATLGRGDIGLLEDGWTLVSIDGSWAAQFEHTVLVTDEGCEILTQLGAQA